MTEGHVLRAYHLAALLTGCRPSELANIKLSDIDLKSRMLIIRNPKAELDIHLPITPEIAFALAMSINAPPQVIGQEGLHGMEPGEVRVVERKKPHGEVIADDFVFPGYRQAGQRSGLPISGNALRHTFRTIAVDCEISEMLIHFLCGHALDGVSEEYTNKLMIEKGPAMRAAQEKISARMFELLGLTLDSYHETPLAPEPPTYGDRRAGKSHSRINIDHARLSMTDISEIEHLWYLANCQAGIALNEVRLTEKAIGQVEDQESEDQDDPKAYPAARATALIIPFPKGGR